MNMFLTNKTRLKIKDIVKRISVDEQVSLDERIFVEKYAKHNAMNRFLIMNLNSKYNFILFIF